MLAMDHRNDVFSNSVAIATASIGASIPIVWYVDALGALGISLYVRRRLLFRLSGLPTHADGQFLACRSCTRGW